MSEEHPQPPDAGERTAGERLQRHRGWIVTLTLVAVIVLVSLLAGRSIPRGGPPAVAFGVKVRPPAGAALEATNGWLARSGAEQVAVYAGSEASNRGNGLLLIVRADARHSRRTRLVIRGSGAVTLLRPSPPPTEAAALHAQLRFITAAGTSGILDVGDARAALIR